MYVGISITQDSFLSINALNWQIVIKYRQYKLSFFIDLFIKIIHFYHIKHSNANVLQFQQFFFLLSSICCICLKNRFDMKGRENKKRMIIISKANKPFKIRQTQIKICINIDWVCTFPLNLIYSIMVAFNNEQILK